MTGSALTLLLAMGMSMGATTPAGAAASAKAPADLSASGTLLFIKNHNLWMARGNGRDAVQVTRDGTASTPYSSPSMADNGRFAVAHGGRFAVFEPNGALVASWQPEPLFLNSKGGVMPPPFDPVLSPNGRRVAYQQVRTYHESGSFKTDGVFGITPLKPDVIDDIVIGGDPAWLSNDRVMFSNGGTGLYTVGSEQSRVTWFTAEDFLEVEQWEWNELSDPALSPDGRTVMVEASSGNELAWVRVVGDPKTGTPPAPTQLVCRAYEEQDVPDGYLSHYENPDYGPEADAAVFEQYGDIYRIDKISSCDERTTINKIVPGGTDPDWSPVSYNPPRGDGTSPGTKVNLKGGAKLTGRALVGKTLKIKLGATEPAKTQQKYTWFRNGKKIRGATGKALKLTRADRGKKISAKAVLSAAGYQPLVVRTGSLKVR